MPSLLSFTAKYNPITIRNNVGTKKIVEIVLGISKGRLNFQKPIILPSTRKRSFRVGCGTQYQNPEKRVGFFSCLRREGSQGR
jgi:hypothetical protein